jgi:hypothetical protein
VSLRTNLPGSINHHSAKKQRWDHGSGPKEPS